MSIETPKKTPADILYEAWTGKAYVPPATPPPVSEELQGFGEAIGVLPPDAYVLRARALCEDWRQTRGDAAETSEEAVQVLARVLRSDAEK